MTNNLSGSQLDLFLHGEGDPFAPGHVKPHQFEHSKERQRDKKHNEMFLASEKNGLSNGNMANSSSNHFDIDDETIETSTL